MYTRISDTVVMVDGSLYRKVKRKWTVEQTKERRRIYMCAYRRRQKESVQQLKKLVQENYLNLQ